MIETLPKIVHAFTRSVGSALVMLLFCTFIILKLFGVIDWSWFWAFAPFWILFCLLAGLAVLASVAGLGYLILRTFRR